MHVVIVGCGVIGVTAAWFLTRAGVSVTVVERREGPALETSFANASMLTPSLSSPWNSPGVWLKLLKHLGRKEAALLIRAAAFPGLFAWGCRFLRDSSPARHQLNMKKNLRLCNYSVEIMEEINSFCSVDFDSDHSGIIEVCRDEAAMRRGRARSRFLGADEVPTKELSPSEVVEREPALEPIAGELSGGFYFPADQVGDAYKFSCGLAQIAAEQGAVFRYGDAAKGLFSAGGKVGGVRLRSGEEIEADSVVAAAGSYTPALVRPLGVRVPVCPAKGYSLTAPMPKGLQPLVHAVLDDRYKAGVVPLGGRIRVGGTVEFTGFNQDLSPERVANLHTLLAAVLPRHAGQIALGDVQPWCGLRPASPDGVPIIGPTPVEGLHLATGHGHLGWSMAAGTGKMLAQHLTGAKPDLPLSDYALARFA
ncbi:MAG: D-amino acid dehydrogenase [Gammaproteobacteria bacterium]|nr:D-amino acid dehydrogenase [Gammaproteobacteria bacterium]